MAAAFLLLEVVDRNHGFNVLQIDVLIALYSTVMHSVDGF